MLALIASSSLGLVTLATPATPAAAQVAAPTVTAQPATAVGLDVNWTAVSGAAGYRVTATDNAGGASVTSTCFACTHLVIRGGLQLLHFYTVSVTPVNASGAAVGPAGTAVSATYYDLAPMGLTSLSASEIAGTQTLRVTWAYHTQGIAAERIQLSLHSVNATGGLSYVSGTDVYRTVEPNEYTIPVLPGRWAVVATPFNAVGPGPTSTSSTVTVANSCAGADLCARITGGGQAVRLVAQGFLHGTPVAGIPEVKALEPKQWRITGRDLDTVVRSYGGSRTQILSDLWQQATAPSNGGFARTPWADWSAWRTFVRDTVNRARSEGWSPDYWDIWNEPNGFCCPKFSSVDLPTATTARWFQTYEEAWRAIKAADSSAKVVAPSTSELQWTNELWPDPAPEFDLDAFLTFSAEKSLVWDAIAWHENDLQPNQGDISYSIANVARHFERGRVVMARHPGTVVNNRIFVNEYGPSEVHLLAGWAVGYFKALEDGGVAQANRTCWTEAECASMNGLWTPAPEIAGLYWAHRLYADLDDGSPMTVQSSAPWQFDGLANRDDATQTVRALLGRHWWCNKAVNGWCPYDAGVAPASANVTIDWPYGTAPVTVTVSRIPAGTGPLAAPVEVSSQSLTPSGGSLSVAVPAVADGDALSVIATPTATTTTTTSTSTTTTSTTTTTAPPTTTVAGKPPTMTSATAVQGPSHGTIKVSWAPAQPNGAPATAYTAACASPGAASKSVTTNGSTLSATVGGLTWWRSYTCSVSATNNFGTSAPLVAQPSSLRPRF